MENKDLAITAMLENCNYFGKESLFNIEILPQVKLLEEEQQNKAKEEERLRIVGILEGMIGIQETMDSPIEEAISRISQ